jgi:hypothetical protein
MRKSKPYLTPAGRKWLREKHAQLTEDGRTTLANIFADLLAHESDLITPPRKRGRPRLKDPRVEDHYTWLA